ncbi:MAG: hypothetical protein ABIP90_00490 [Vicinamibacterales bacterium]
MPAAPSGLTASRIGERVTVRVVVPEANADPASPLSISGIEIYARTLPMGSESPMAEQLIRKEYLVATIPVRPPALLDSSGDPIPPSATTPPDTRPGPGETIVWSEAVPATAVRPLELTRAQKAKVEARRTVWLPIAPTGVLAPWFRFPLPTRYYAAVGVSERRQPGMSSTFAAVSFGPPPDAPTGLKVEHTESEVVVSWITAVVGAPVMVIETTNAGVEKPGAVQELPITTGSWSTPVTFGVERCFAIRGILRRGAVSTESATEGPKCDTPKDIYGPPAPVGLLHVSDPDTVTLVWDAVTAPDLAGYLVLRATGASETLQELTPSPITQLQFADTTTRTGQRYVYYVVAVDTAGNRGPRSSGVTVDRFTLTGK